VGRNDDDDDIDAFLASLEKTSAVRRDSSSEPDEADAQSGTRVLVADALDAVRRAASEEKPEASADPASTESSDLGFEDPQLGLEDPDAPSETRALMADALAAVRRAASEENPEASVDPASTESSDLGFEDPRLGLEDPAAPSETRALMADALAAVRRAASEEKSEASADPASTESSDLGFEDPQLGLEDPAAPSETRALVADALAAVRRAAGVEKPESSAGPAMPGSAFEGPEVAKPGTLPPVESAETSWATPSEEQEADIKTTVFSTEERFAPSGEEPRGGSSVAPTAIVERARTAARNAFSSDRGVPIRPILVLVAAVICGVLVAISATVLVRGLGTPEESSPPVSLSTGESADAAAPDIASPSDSIDAAAPDIASPSDSIDAAAPDIARPSDSIDAAAPDIARPSDSIDVAAPDIASPSDSVDAPVPDIAALELMVREGKHEKAVFGGLELLKADPRRADVYRVLGIAYSRLRYKTEACESYRRYLQLAPQAPDRGNIEDIVAMCE
jgi:hypothetical protein